MLKKLIKHFLWNIKGGYQPKKFWNKWAKTFMDDPWQVKIHSQHVWMLKKIKSINPENILEFGCGFGRNIKFLIENDIPAKNITGVDLSEEMIKKAKKYISNSSVSLKVSDAAFLPFKPNTFDIVITHGVFMHIKPQDIEQAVKEIKKVCKKYIISIEQNYDGNEYTFVHYYKEIFEKHKLQIVENINKNGLDYFLLRKNND